MYRNAKTFMACAGFKRWGDVAGYAEELER